MIAFGPYEVIETVAVGSTGTVFRARHREIDRIAAIKELNATMRAVPGLLARFRAEAHTLAALDDEHVVAIFDFVEEPDRVWIAEEWVDGLTIAALLTSAGHFTAEQSLGILRGALLGLAHAHDRGLVHRDFAPSNILADLAGTSKLVDFGLAAPVGDTGTCGTPAYMSPEAARGEPVSKSSDVYSAGAVLFSLLSGRVPFAGRSTDAVLQAHIQQPPPPLTGHGPALAALLTDAMAKDAAARPPDARAFLTRLEEAARDRYGVGWLERASIAGLVAAAAGSATVAATSTVGAATSTAAGAAAATVFVETQVATGQAAVRKIARFGRRMKIGLAVGTVLAVGGITAAVALAGNDSKNGSPSAAGDPTAAATGSNVFASPTVASSTSVVSSPSATPTPTLRDVSPVGIYRVTVKVTSTNIPGDKVGSSSNTWTIKFTCAAKKCKGRVSSSSGRKFTATYDGTTFVAKRSQAFTGQCIYYEGPRKGQKQPGTLAVVTDKTTFRATVVKRSNGPVPTADVPLRLRGPSLIRESAKVLKAGNSSTGICHASPTTRSKGTITMTFVR